VIRPYVDYVIPSNDDAIRAIKLMVAKMRMPWKKAKRCARTRKSRRKSRWNGLRRKRPESAGQARTTGMEDELEDTKLLGESTLAKLAPAPKVEELPVEELPDVGEDEEQAK